MIFETDRLILRPRTMRDFDACIAMDKAPGVIDYIPGPWENDADHRAFVRTRINTQYGDGLGYWSIFAKSAPDIFIGWVLLIPEDAKGPDIEIGWRLHPDYWAKGFATEAALALVPHAFETLNLPRIVAGIDARNMGSIGVARKIGMTFQSHQDGYDMFVLENPNVEMV
ncbi:GNAT family N-acetyltransferase [Thalassospira lucentensis]|uniref:GNAT family N-acetyltransferase n=1 Tax=Thalassospira lucentensis TaxID=168935 RepID=UPI00142D79E9|nr:GNAT family N-acetyltransferase [Thalassospira lucentensis]NIZ00232.1 GNAT family N-acetyltransferase [Thalassospira lucentensis]